MGVSSQRIYNNPFEFNCPIPHLQEGSNRIKMKLTDNSFNSESPEQFFTYNYNNPKLSLSSPSSKTFLTKNGNQKSLTLTFSYADKNGNDNLKLFYKLDEGSYLQFSEEFTISSYSVTYTKTISLDIDQSLKEGDHTYNFYLIDQYRKQSQTVPYTYNFKHNAPVISDLTMDTKPYRNKVDIINISGTITDLDGNGTVIISLFINDIEFENTTISIETTSPIPFSFIYPNSNNDLRDGSNSITIKAEDNEGKTAIKTTEFKFSYNAPDLQLKDVKSSYSFTKNLDLNQINIKYDVTDIDGPTVIKILYNIDSRVEKLYESLETTSLNLSFFDKPMNINIPQDLTEGNHTVFIWATDGAHNSTKREINFQFKHNAPKISLSSKNKNDFTNNIDTPIIIQGDVYDLDGTGTITITLVLDNYSINSTQIKISNILKHEFSFQIQNTGNCLSEGRHNYSVIAEDELLKNSTESSYFILKYSNPIITTKNVSNSKIKLKKNENISLIISYSVSDIDFPCYIQVKYKINGNNAIVLKSFNLTREGPVLRSDKISLNEPLKVGTNKISIFAVDDKYKSSEPQHIRFEIIDKESQRRKISIIIFPETCFCIISLTCIKSSGK